jgi:hypothetical protein
MWSNQQQRTKQAYENTKKKNRTGQGSGNSPFIWKVLSSKMIKIYDKYKERNTMTHRTNKQQI